jgi:L-asparagine oxygenase
MEVDLVKCVEIGHVPPTPIVPTHGRDIVPTAYDSLLKHSSLYGTVFGYKQEQHGVRVQHVLPNPKTEYIQMSTSSKVELELHTETAFHPYKPDYLLLLCLRGDSNAPTTYAKVSRIVEMLDDDTLEILQQPLYATSLDDSFRTDGSPDATIIVSVLRKHDDFWEMTYDNYLMKGLTVEAQSALDALRTAASRSIEEVVLESGDLLVLNNKTVIHGRKPFQPRYDGTDRWLLRAMTKKNYPPLAHYDAGSFVITTTFNNGMAHA